jgi:hypothetical protein
MTTSRRRVSFAFALLAGLLGGPGAISVPASSNAAVARIPFELNGNVLFLPVRVNGSAPLWFVLDTGAHGSLVNSTVAEALRLPKSGASTSHGAGGSAPGSRIPRVTLDVGGARLADLTVTATSLGALENNTGRAMDGILGSQLFRRYVVEIDYETSQITLYEPAGFDAAGRGQSLPLRFQDEHPYVRAKLTLPGQRPIEDEFVVDLGSNLPLILLPSFIEERRLRSSLPPTVDVVGRGVGGEVGLPMGRSSRLELGSHVLEAPVTAFPRSGMFGRVGKAGNIGSAVLRRFRVTFDYSRNRMILEPNRRFTEPFEFDMSGLQLASESPRFEVVRVNRVLPGSPAAEAGIRQADEILSIAGKRSTAMRLAELREMLRQPDRQYALELKRGSETITVELKTRRLI